MEADHWSEFEINASLTDKYGHMNNASYMKLLEDARWKWLADAGVPMEKVREENMGPVVLEAHLRFRKEVLENDRVRILTRVARFRPPLFEVQHEMRNQNGVLCCSANYKLGFFDLKTRSLAHPSKIWLLAFKGIANERIS